MKNNKEAAENQESSKNVLVKKKIVALFKNEKKIGALIANYKHLYQYICQTSNCNIRD